MENQLLKVTIDHIGQVRSVLERESGTEFVDGIANQFLLYQDINVDYDAWEISSFYKDVPVKLNQEAAISIEETGPLKVVLLVKRQIHKSAMTREYPCLITAGGSILQQKLTGRKPTSC